MSNVRSFLASSVLLTVLACVPAFGEEFTSGEGRFKVSIPAKPGLEKTTLQTAAGPILLHNYTAETKAGAYFIGYFDLPAGVPPTERIDAILDGAVGGMVANTKGTLIKSDKIEMAAYPAREVLWSFPANKIEARGRARLALVGARMYQVFVLGGEPFVGSKLALDYLKSFTFDAAPGIKPPGMTAPTREAPAAGPPVDWQPFNAKNNDGGYTVQVPAKLERGQAPGILGIKNRTVFTCSVEGLTFTIMGQPVPPPAMKKGGAPAVLTASRDSLASAHNGKVTTDKSIKIGDFPAREFRITSASLRPNVILARSVVAGRRLYTLFVLGSEAAVSGPSAQKFLTSFTPTE